MRRLLPSTTFICVALQFSCSETEPETDTGSKEQVIVSDDADNKSTNTVSVSDELVARLLEIDNATRSKIESTDSEANDLSDPKERAEFFGKRRKVIKDLNGEISILYQNRLKLLLDDKTLETPENEEAYWDETREKYQELIDEFERSTGILKKTPNKPEMATSNQPSD